MKRAVIAATALVLVFACCITAFAFPTISTEPDNQEWKSSKAKEINLLDDNNKSGNDITVADVDCVFDNETNEVYYRFSIVTKSQAQDCSDFRVSIQLDGIPEIISLGAEDFGVKGETDKSNPDYHIEYILYSGNSSNFFCKLKVRYNNGIDRKAGGSIQIWDKNGASSNKLDFDFENPNYTITVTEADDTSKTKKETTTKRRVRDRETSSKKPISTSRVATTKRETTTKKPTTTEKVTTTKATTVKTTKTKTTKAKRTATKAAKADEASVSVVTSIVYVVPETILSGTVYVTDDTEQGSEKSAFGIENMQKSTLMKIAAGAAALVLLGAIGVMAVKSKKDGDKDENTGKNNEE